MHLLRAGERQSAKSHHILGNHTGGGDHLSSLRRFLMRLALDSHTPDSVLDRACHAITEVTGAACSFVESEHVPAPAPGYLTMTVTTKDVPIGALVVDDACLRNDDLGTNELQEIADLVGICLLSASQAQVVSELQDDSEDMLYFAPDAIFVLTQDGVVAMANQQALSFVGESSENVVGKQIENILSTRLERPSLLREVALAGGTVELETHCRSGTRLASLTLSLVGEGERSAQILCVVRDITEERQAMLALRKSERTIMMGKAVEYLLHEVNNPLAALLVNLNLAKERCRLVGRADGITNGRLCEVGMVPGDPMTMNQGLTALKKALDGAGKAALRIKDTMAMLRTAHRGEDWTAVGIVDPGYEISLAVAAAMEEASEAVRIDRIIDGIQHLIRAPSLLLAEAIGALLKNALQAVVETESPQIRVWGRESGERILISVSDNGPGVDEGIRRRIFMPFFTTKRLGDALGLGLTLAEDTVRRLGGELELASGGLGGATFDISLPLVNS